MGSQSKSLLALARRINSFYLSGLQSEWVPLVCTGCQVGLVSPPVLAQLLLYPEVFTVTKDAVTVSERLDDAEARSTALEGVLLDIKKKGLFPALNGWRAERYEIRKNFSEPPLFCMERSATPLFGLRQYGVHINGFVRHSSRGPCLWLQRRSATKPTWPGLLDTFVGGGLSEGLGVLETAVKEAGEEANVPQDLARTVRSAGTVSFLHQSDRGLHPNTEFVFDLELPETFIPGNNDGEVSGFELVPVGDIVSIITSKVRTNHGRHTN